jgi:hypothetical protein
VTYQVVPATEEHAAELVANVRAADAAELWAGWRHTPAEAVAASMRVSRDTLAGIEPGGKLLCLFGVAPATALSDFASPWMIGTEELPRHARAFLRVSRAWTGLIREEYSILLNYVDERNVLAVKWLRWLGFTIREPEPFGPDGLPFHRFEAIRHV